MRKVVVLLLVIFCSLVSSVHAQGAGGDGAGGGSCFPSNTQVTMADNTKKPIQDVKVGDVIKGKDGPAQVYELESPLREGYYRIFFGGKVLNVTNEHPIWTNKGWASIQPEATYMDSGMVVKELQTKDKINGKPIKRIEYVDKQTQTYNLKHVEDNTFYANDVLVHNKGSCFPADTQINMSEGSKPIQEIEVGDMVKSYNLNP